MGKPVDTFAAAERKRKKAQQAVNADIEKAIQKFKDNAIERINSNIGNRITDETGTGLFHTLIQPVDGLVQEIKNCLQSLKD